MSATVKAARCRAANRSAIRLYGWHPVNRPSGTRYAARISSK